MTVVKKEQTPEEKEQEGRDINVRKKDAVNAVLASLELPVKEPVKEKEQEPLKKEEELNEIPKKEEELTEEDILKIPDEDLTEEGLAVKRELEEKAGEDELIPKSKVDKRFSQLTKKIKDLESKLQHKEEAEPKAQDPDDIRLEKMNKTELLALKQKVKKAVLREEDDEKVDSLIELESKIDNAILTMPARFQTKQVKAYNKAAEKISSDTDIENFEEAIPKIVELANQIFSEYPKLQRLEDGQAMALNFAVAHYKEMAKSSSNKSTLQTVKRNLSKLKKKVTLDSNLLKVNRKQVSLSRLREKAGRGGTLLDKQEFIKQSPQFNIDALIPDEFKER